MDNENKFSLDELKKALKSEKLFTTNEDTLRKVVREEVKEVIRKYDLESKKYQ